MLVAASPQNKNRYVPWKHGSVCGLPDDPPPPKASEHGHSGKRHSPPATAYKPPPEPKQEDGFCCFDGGCERGCDSVADRSNWCARTKSRCETQCGSHGFPWCPGPEPPPPSAARPEPAAQAAAAAAAAREEALPGHCCFAGGCNGCGSLAAPSNYCALGR